jgi:hypothetical protein
MFWVCVLGFGLKLNVYSYKWDGTLNNQEVAIGKRVGSMNGNSKKFPL